MIGVASEAVLFPGSASGVPSVVAIEAVFKIWVTLGGVRGETVSAKMREPLPATGTEPRLKVQTEPGDVSEDEAAAQIAKATAGEGVHVDRAFTGRANLFAERA